MNKRLMNAKDAELIVKTSVLKRRRKDKTACQEKNEKSKSGVN